MRGLRFLPPQIVIRSPRYYLDQRALAHLTFDEAGPWAFHCHVLLHRATGMFVKVIVDDARALSDPS